MRDLVVRAVVTLDGVVQAPGGPAEIGLFAFEEPTDAERECRERLVNS